MTSTAARPDQAWTLNKSHDVSTVTVEAFVLELTVPASASASASGLTVAS